MSGMPRLLLSISLSAILILLNPVAQAQGDVANVSQIHIRLNAQSKHTPKTQLTADEATSLSSAAGMTLTPNAVTPDDAHILGLPRAMTRAEAWAIATKLSTRSDIAHVEPVDPDFNIRPPTKPPVNVKAGTKP